ncbi:MAG: hypothetical protein EOP04_05505 [Proteobacteria bacterium]|nr:MAG: hypothetical protein EOP04_05505 [Pseudomonadota bacterium]
MKQLLIIAGLFLASCGTNKPASEVQSELPDNYATRSTCYGLSQDIDTPVRVEADDQIDVRLCANLQKDGHVAFDVQYKPQKKLSAYPIFALVTLDDGKGGTASELFRMTMNPYTGKYQLYLTDGCLVGRFGGCAQDSQKKMQDLLDILNARESKSAFDISLAFVAIKSDKETQWDLHNPARKENYKFSIREL